MRVIVSLAASLLIAASIMFCISRGFAADTAERNVEEMFVFLQTENYRVAESHFDTELKAAMPVAKLKETWGQMTGRYGMLKSFRVVSRPAAGASETRIVILGFEKAPGQMVAQVKAGSSGEIQEVIFRPAVKGDAPPKAPPSAQKKAASKTK